MKTLVILAIILAILAAYFVFNTEKSLSLKDRGNAIPAGIDIAKSILKQVLNQTEKINPKVVDSVNGVKNGSSVMQPKLTEKIKSKIRDIKDKILGETVNLIKTPIENKVSDLLCPQK